jgi:DNA-binding SARP family transcriptional activator
MTLDVRLLGGFQLAWRGEPLALSSARARALLARLALHAGEPQARALLAPLFWPDSTDAQARTNLRRLLHELWQVLPDPARFVATGGADLTWRADAPATLDVAEFAGLAARTEEPAAIARAVTLYRGDLLPECYDDWIAPERERLREFFARALSAGIALGSAAGDWPAALTYANRLVELDPLDEEAHRRRMQVHLRRGDRSAAIRAYQECAALLERELGVAPSAATRALYEQDGCDRHAAAP